MRTTTATQFNTFQRFVSYAFFCKIYICCHRRRHRLLRFSLFFFVIVIGMNNALRNCLFRWRCHQYQMCSLRNSTVNGICFTFACAQPNDFHSKCPVAAESRARAHTRIGVKIIQTMRKRTHTHANNIYIEDTHSNWKIIKAKRKSTNDESLLCCKLTGICILLRPNAFYICVCLCVLYSPNGGAQYDTMWYDTITESHIS